MLIYVMFQGRTLKQMQVLATIYFMPAKNSIKIYLEDGYYHIYNRGVEKRLIFQDSQDYSVFLSYLKDYLTPKDEKEIQNKISEQSISRSEKAKIRKLLTMKNYSVEISLFAYCLMPNHFHLFVKQKDPGSINNFMTSLGTRYGMYFNRKYQRVGPLFQGRYKAVLVNSEAQYLHLTRYIHHQALLLQGRTLEQQPSSYPEYTGIRNTGWVHPEEVLSFFSNTNPQLSYANFAAEEDELTSGENSNFVLGDD